jgi:hypothetical protein
MATATSSRHGRRRCPSPALGEISYVYVNASKFAEYG